MEVKVHKHKLKYLDFDSIIPPLCAELNVRDILTCKNDDMEILMDSILENGLQPT